MSSIKVTIENIGPTEAKALLDANTHNRKQHTEAQLAAMARDMAAGRWALNGEAIKVSQSGVLLDGQGRLKAIVLSGATIETLVVRGLPEETQETMDIGAVRTLADMLHLRGTPNGRDVAAAAMVVWKLDRNGHLFGGDGYPYPSKAELLDYIDLRPDIESAARFGNAVTRRAGFRYPKALASGLFYLMRRQDAENATHFWDRFADGVGLSRGNPVLTLRELIRNQDRPGHGLTSIVLGALTIKAWNAFLDGRPVFVLRWTRGGATPESFPSLSKAEGPFDRPDQFVHPDRGVRPAPTSALTAAMVEYEPTPEQVDRMAETLVQVDQVSPEPPRRVMRWADMSPEERRLVTALINADKAAKKAKEQESES